MTIFKGRILQRSILASSINARVSFFDQDSGQSLIEVALSVPLLILILMGAAEIARFGWAAIETSNAARAGAQYGAQTNITAADSAGIRTAALNDGINLAGLSATPSTSCVCSNATGTTITCTNALASCAAPNVIIEYVQVTTTATIAPLYHWPGLPATFTATGSSIMEVAQP